MRWLKVLTATTMVLYLAACQTTVRGASENINQYITVVMPTESGTAQKPYPVVFLLPGSSCSSSIPDRWAGWLSDAGMAAVVIHSCRLHGITTARGYPERNLAKGYTTVVEGLRDDPRFDLSRHAVMGFSRGGTAAMLGGGEVPDGQQAPQVAVALYPGDAGRCPVSHAETTQVHIYYGSADDYGAFQGNRNSCRRTAERHANVTYHSVEGAHHGFDGTWAGSWSCCGGNRFTNKPDADATAQVRDEVINTFQAAFSN